MNFKERKLTPSEVKQCKQYFDNNVGSRMMATQGHIGTLMAICFDVFKHTNYSIIQDNLTQLF